MSLSDGDSKSLRSIGNSTLLVDGANARQQTRCQHRNFVNACIHLQGLISTPSVKNEYIRHNLLFSFDFGSPNSSLYSSSVSTSQTYISQYNIDQTLFYIPTHPFSRLHPIYCHKSHNIEAFVPSRQ
jgi:hypothetical protein